MKISHLSIAAAVLALALTQTSGAGTLTLNNIVQGPIGSVSINSAGDMVVTTGAPPPPPAPGVPACTLGANPLNIAPTQTSTLAVTSCTNNPDSYTWTASSGAPAAPPGTGGTIAFPNVGTFTYSVTPANTTTGLTGTPSSVTINVATPPPPGSCPTPTGTVTNYNVLWNPQGGTPKQLFRIKKDEIAALKFTADNNSGRNGYLTWVPNTSVSSKSVIVNISKCPGDFTQPSSPATYLCRAEGTENTILYNQAASYTGASYACSIGTGDYYINIRNGARTSGSNKDPSYAITDSCPAGAICGVNVEFR